MNRTSTSHVATAFTTRAITGAWDTLPTGWTEDSLDKFWSSLTSDHVHKVTECMKQMEGKVDNTGAFCGSLADKVDPGWRSRQASWNQGTHVPVRDLPPFFQRALKDIGYGRRDIEVRTGTTFSFQDMGGDGYQSFVVVLNMETGQSKTWYGSWGGPNPFSRRNPVDDDDRPHPIPANGAIIEGRHGGVHPTYATITVGPDNVATLLPDPGPDLTEDEKKALKIIGTLKPGYREEEWSYRKKLPGHYEPRNPIIQSLADKGMVKINAAGAIQITTAGRNAY